jgi:hypothetical protein
MIRALKEVAQMHLGAGPGIATLDRMETLAGEIKIEVRPELYGKIQPKEKHYRWYKGLIIRTKVSSPRK